jgi:hypothetical protein
MSTINNIGLASDLTPSSKKVDSLTILRGLEIQGNLINNAVETAKDNESCLVTRTTNLAIDNLGPNPVVFNTEVFDGHNNFSGSVYTVRFNGVYSVSCHVEFAANWSYRQESSCRACDSGTTSLTVTIGPCIMERGTLIEANASQTAAASLNIIGGSLFVTLIRLSDTLL